MSQSAASDKWYYCYLPNGLASGATSLLIPLFAKELGATVGQVGIIAAISSVASIPAFVLWGHLSDKLENRKLFIILGFLGMAITLMMMGLSWGVEEYYFANLLFGFLTSASAPVATVLMIETVAKEQWAKRIADFSKIGGIGYVSGLVLGAFWLQMDLYDLTAAEGMRTLFAIGAALAFVSAIIAWWLIEEPKERMKGRPGHISEHHFITIERLKFVPFKILHFGFHEKKPQKFSRSLYAYLFCIFLLFSGFTAFYAFFPIFLVDEMGMQSSAIFLIYIASQATSVAFYTRVGAWVKTQGGKKMQLIGSGARTILFPAFMAVALLHVDPAIAFLLVFILHAVVGLCWAMINVAGSMIVSGLAACEIQGEAFGAYNAVQGFGAIAGPVVGGMICQFLGYPAGFLSTSVFILLGIIVLLKLKVDAK